MMSVERNKAIVRRLFEVWNTGNLDAIEELYAADYVADYRPYAPLRHGYDAIKGMVQRAHVAFPDYHEELEEMIAGRPFFSITPTPLPRSTCSWCRTHLSLHKDAPVRRDVCGTGRVLPMPVLGGLHHRYVRV
jgi:SnoaL-like domain